MEERISVRWICPFAPGDMAENLGKGRQKHFMGSINFF